MTTTDQGTAPSGAELAGANATESARLGLSSTRETPGTGADADRRFGG